MELSMYRAERYAYHRARLVNKPKDELLRIARFSNLYARTTYTKGKLRTALVLTLVSRDVIRRRQDLLSNLRSADKLRSNLRTFRQLRFATRRMSLSAIVIKQQIADTITEEGRFIRKTVQFLEVAEAMDAQDAMDVDK